MSCDLLPQVAVHLHTHFTNLRRRSDLIRSRQASAELGEIPSGLASINLKLSLGKSYSVVFRFLGINLKIFVGIWRRESLLFLTVAFF